VAEDRGILSLWGKIPLPGSVWLENRARSDLRWIGDEYSTRYRWRMEATREFNLSQQTDTLPQTSRLNASGVVIEGYYCAHRAHGGAVRRGAVRSAVAYATRGSCPLRRRSAKRRFGLHFNGTPSAGRQATSEDRRRAC